jgi:hypothetical protein
MSKIYHEQRLYTIYEEELNDLTYNPTGIFDKFLYYLSRKFTPRIDLKYTITVPAADFLRGELFCEDISEVIEKPFTQTNLISILLDDFLYQANHRKNLRHLFKDFHSEIQRPIEIFHYRGEHEILYVDKEVRKTTEIVCTMKRKKALRLEVILNDLDYLETERPYTVNDVIQLIYRHFIEKYKNGNVTAELEGIIKRLA